MGIVRLNLDAYRYGNEQQRYCFMVHYVRDIMITCVQMFGQMNENKNIMYNLKKLQIRKICKKL